MLTGQPDQCLAPPLLDPAGDDVSVLLTTATDAVSKHNYPVVTMHPVDDQSNAVTGTVTD